MSAALFEYPKQAMFDRVLPKNKIYEHGKPSRSLRAQFVTEVSQIVWRYKLSPETINLPQRDGIAEIQIFAIALKTPEASEAVLRCIDNAIPFPIFYELSHADRIKSKAAFKRASDADSAKWIVQEYFETEWTPAAAPRQPLPVALDMSALYERLLRLHIEVPERTNESLKAQVERISTIRSKTRESQKLQLRLQQEQQFNRKVELNSQLREINEEIASLRG